MANKNVIFVSIVLALAVCSCWAECPPKEATVPFQVDKFVGTWYLIAASPTSGDSVSNCSSLLVQSRGDHEFQMEFNAKSRRNGKPVKFFMEGDGDDEDVTGTWHLAGSDKILGPFKHRVLEAKYDEYASLIVCADNTKDIAFKQFGMVLSRAKTLSPTVLSESKTKIGTYVGHENVQNVDHDDCAILSA